MLKKRILILTTYYPPDTAISAVRPYMFAKYLSNLGYQVTVLRSGEINSIADGFGYEENELVEVFSFMGEDSPAERFERGEKIDFPSRKSRLNFFPIHLKKAISKFCHSVLAQREFKMRMQKVDAKFFLQKKYLDQLKESGNSFDVVFATYSELENVYAGEYAAKIFNCKYILDFRDLIAQKTFSKGKIFKVLLNIQRNAILSSDVCTCVSEHIAKDLQKLVPEKSIVTLYNGYEPIEQECENKIKINNEFSFCYTGQIYDGLRDASPLFQAISENCKDGMMKKENVHFYYAGKNYELIQEQAKKYEMESVLVNLGYLGRKEVQELQATTDIFTVLSWNTHQSHGILTGKFYEGIRCAKPILSIVSGDESYSELKTMNDKYHYGFCYETANNGDDFEKLKKWILSLYQKKMAGIEITNTAVASFYSDFRYDRLTEKLDQIINNIINKESNDNVK